ncbi:MAG: FtsQ-type POTRA domain-containing protein [Clostridia bacterium]|nr:FtsQ-type POTRA domain-containing protein [Clostridia bacterium]
MNQGTNSGKREFYYVPSKKQNKKNKKKKKIRNKPLTVFLLAAAVIIVALILAFVFLRISAVRFEGNRLYSEEELLEASRIRIGERMYGIDKKEISETIIRNCPYVKSVRITRTLPGTLNVKIEEYDAGFYVEIGDEYYVLGENLIVLEREMNYENVKRRGLILLDAGNILSAVVGQPLKLAAGSDTETVKNVMSAAVESNVYGRMTRLNVRDKYNIFAVCDELYKLILGDSRDITVKLNLGGKILEDSMFDGNVTRAQVDLSDPEECGVIIDNQISFE